MRSYRLKKMVEEAVLDFAVAALEREEGTIETVIRGCIEQAFDDLEFEDVVRDSVSRYLDYEFGLSDMVAEAASNAVDDLIEGLIVLED